MSLLVNDCREAFAHTILNNHNFLPCFLTCFAECSPVVTVKQTIGGTVLYTQDVFATAHKHHPIALADSKFKSSRNFCIHTFNIQCNIL